MVNYLSKPYEKKELEKILNPTIKNWFFSKFKEFSEPQLYGVMEIHKRNNILISAPTGGTKTLTSFLSVLNELVDSAEKGILEDKVYCIYVSPLKALNEDIKVNLIEPLKEIEDIAGRKLGIRVAVRTGDTPTSERAKMTKKPPHILITTPESLGILLTTIKFREHFKKVDWCIIDEIHSLAEGKRGVHLSLSLERLQHLCGHMTRVGLSATIAPLDEIAEYLVGYEKNKPRQCKIVDVQFNKKMDLKVLCPVKDLIATTGSELHNNLYKLLHDLIQEHKTTLIFTNTRSATERVVYNLQDMFPKFYTDKNIGAHHGSLGKAKRHGIEDRLRKGEMKVVVSSTSLELGLDIGFIDLVVCLTSPKSVARLAQRLGRSGHKLHETIKGRLIAMDRDDLVECSVMLKDVLERKIDRVHIPVNCLDVLAQQIDGMAIEDTWDVKEVFKVVKQSYNYKDLSKKDFDAVIDYLAGKYTSLEDRHVYAKIWHKNDRIGRRGKMGRVIYMTNIGTIPDETHVLVKIGDHVVGKIDEGFLEKLKRGDIFVLGGQKYEFLFSRGMTAQVRSSVQRPPTIPSWYSEMLPLNFDLAVEIGKFRRLVDGKLNTGKSKKEIIGFIDDYLHVDKNSAKGIYDYIKEQHMYAHVANDKRIVIENYSDDSKKYIIFHSMYGRRVNDCLSRVIGYAAGKIRGRDIEIGINDNGFYLASDKMLMIEPILKLIKSSRMRELAELAINKTEILSRRFRHCAGRAFMILRNYMGRKKRVGRQQVSSMILMNAVKRISKDFPILKEARREVLEDLMDIENATLILKGIEEGKIKIKEVNTTTPSPFAFNLIMQGYTDVLRMEDKIEFLKRLHSYVLAKIGQKQKFNED